MKVQHWYFLKCRIKDSRQRSAQSKKQATSTAKKISISSKESFEDYCSGLAIDTEFKATMRERRDYSNKAARGSCVGMARAKSNPVKYNLTAINRYKRAIVIETEENMPWRKDLPKLNKKDVYTYTTPKNNIQLRLPDKSLNSSNSSLTHVSDTTSFNPIFSYEQENPVKCVEDTNFDKEWLNDYLEGTAPLEIRPEEYSTAKSGKQRRTREERNKKVSKLEAVGESKNYDTLGSDKHLKKYNSTKFLITITPKNMTLTRRAKSGVKYALSRNETSKNMRKVSQAAKEKTRGMPKSASKLTSSNGRKNSDPRKYIARKYLCELYEKVIYKVRELERNKKIAAKKSTVKSCLRNNCRRYTNSNLTIKQSNN